MTQTISIKNEYAPLKRVIIGLGAPYQRDKARITAEMGEYPFVPNTALKEQVLALTYPLERQLVEEYAGFTAVLHKHGVNVLFPDPTAAYSFDYTCPRDIGFVIGDTFFVSRMAVPSRAEEYKTILPHLAGVAAEKIVWAPDDVLIEGGDVIVVDARTILVGINQRTNVAGYRFLKQYFAGRGVSVIPVRHSQLHLDCCLNPLGQGQMLIHPDSLAGNDDKTWRVLQQHDWIEVDAVEREHLATNVLSIDPETIIGRTHPSCARVNAILRDLGYIVEEILFDGVPATGGSFRCASLVLERSG